MNIIQSHLTEIVYFSFSSAAVIILRTMIRNIEGQAKECWNRNIEEIFSATDHVQSAPLKSSLAAASPHRVWSEEKPERHIFI